MSYFHYPIPVVSGGYSEEGQKSHPKVPERGMPSQPLAGMRVITLCGTKHSRETPHSHTSPTPSTGTGRLTKVSKQLHSKSCKYEKQQHEEKTQIPHLEREKETGGKKHTHTKRTFIDFFVPDLFPAAFFNPKLKLLQGKNDLNVRTVSQIVLRKGNVIL